MKTYCVIPQYIQDEKLYTLAKEMIESVRATEPDITIISVDDASPNKELGKKISEMADVALFNEENQGFARTCNKGFEWIMKNTDEDVYIVCANNDIVLYEGWLNGLTEPYDMFDNVGITGIIHSRDKESAKTLRINKITNGGKIGDRMQNGGLWCMKKSVMQKVGMFDERFRRGGQEDIDLFIRIRDEYGMKIVMSGRACFWHAEGATRWAVEWKGENKAIEEENKKLFREKWGWTIDEKFPFREDVIWNP